MIISMQGNWTVSVKSKNASFPQRFVVLGASSGNGAHSGTPGTSVNVTGPQWSISIQNDPGTGWQASGTQLKFPHQVGSHYEFDIQSNDAGGDQDYDDLILTCSTPVSINEFLIYGNVRLYDGCIFNPCRRNPFVIDTYTGWRKALKNPRIAEWLSQYYAERKPPFIDDPNPPDPPYFKPLVFDLSGEAMKPKTVLKYARIATDEKKKETKAAKEGGSEFAATNFELIREASARSESTTAALDTIALIKDIERLYYPCHTGPGSNLTLTFEEYDRTSAELAGGAYTGTGNRRLLGDTITDQHGNYIFRFRFDMTFPGLEDAADIAAGENVDVVMFPDVIVKIVDYVPFQVRFESAPYYNIPNLKRIDLCLPESTVHVSSACFNGNLIGSLGNIFIGGNQNASGSTAPAATQRYQYGNFLESTGVITVNSPLAGFGIECAAWAGTIDIKGCMYDAAKSAADNKIKWYTIRVRRSGTIGWSYVTENYKHPKFSKRNLANYYGDDVGPFYPVVGGTLNGTVPSYINIQREIFVDGVDWEFSNLDRYMRLNTALYDIVVGIRTPGKTYVRVDGYDASGNHVPGATDLIALFIHNNGLEFELSDMVLNDPTIVNAGCGLFRLTDAQLKTPMLFSFRANDPYGFVDHYNLTMSRCPGTALDLNANIEGNFTITGSHTFPGGSNASNVHNACPGYKGTGDDYSTGNPVAVQVQPLAMGEGWIKTGEYFTIYSLALTANQRVTNGYNTGLSSTYPAYRQILMERLTP
ncbi:hypothetical protein [Chryseolinea soli]|nr:hypothetical protein [Chryseolinea soli]